MRFLRNLAKWLHHHRAAIAWCILGFAVALAVAASTRHLAKTSADNLYHTQIRTCQRGNATRRLIDNNVQESYNTQIVVREFLQSAYNARKAAFAETHQPTDQAAAQSYLRLYLLEGRGHYKLLPTIDCNKAVPRP